MGFVVGSDGDIINTHKVILRVKSNEPLVHGMLVGMTNLDVKTNKEKKITRFFKKFVQKLNREFYEYKKQNPEASMIPFVVDSATTEIVFFCDENYAVSSMNEYRGGLPLIQKAIGKMVGVSIDIRMEKI